MYKFLVEEVSIYYWLEILVFSVFCVYIFSGTSLKSEKFSEKKSYFIRDFIVLITVHILISFLPVKSIGTVFTFSSVVLLPIAIFSMYHYIIYKDKKTFLKLILSVYFQLIAEVIFVEAYYIFVGVIVQNLGFLRNIMSLEPLADRKSTRLNSSHANISYAVFCLKKKQVLVRPHVTTLISPLARI